MTVYEERERKTIVCKVDEDGAVWTRGFPVLEPDSTVVFQSHETDCVLCISNSSIFGRSRFEIPRGESLEVYVQSDRLEFEWSTKVRSLRWKCEQANEGSGGGYPPAR
jgi:hypothetical protein